MTMWNALQREHLLAWADGEGAPGQLPELVRRLVHETARDRVEAIDFPAGGGVTSGGFDGFVRASSGTPFVPAGTSVWELSVRKDAVKKADEDIAKRASVPDGSPVDETTYIQVIARAWTKAADWARDWKAKTLWRRVEGYNVDRLTAWIEQAPATRVWVLERLGKPTVGVTSGSEWWARWSTSTEPNLTTEVVLARGLGDLDVVIRRSGVATVGGPCGANEIVACVVAAAVAAGAELLDRIVVVDDRNAWQRLLKEDGPLILVAFTPGFAEDVGPASPHTAVVAIPQSDEADVVLASIHRLT